MTTGIGNEWDPGDPPEVHRRERSIKMSGTRGSKLSRAIEFFETADLREVRAAYIIVKEVVEGRLSKVAQPTLPFKAPQARKRKAKQGLAGGQAAAPSSAAVGGAGAAAAPTSMSMAEQERTLADA